MVVPAEPEEAAVDEDDTRSADRAAVEDELGALRRFAQSLRLDEVRDGTWFSRLLKLSLDTYVREVDAAYFERKYPGVPAEAVVQARIQLAARYAGIEGGLSAAAYTGTVAATIGSAGAASPLALPAAGASFVLDLLFVTRLQLRLAHDIAVLYRVPLDLEDPEDLWKLIQIAFAIQAGESGRGALSKGVPLVIRPIVKKVFSGGTLTAVKSLPVVGKYLLQRNLIKFAIPAVGVPLSIAVNHWSVRVAGNQAATVFRRDARIVEAASRMVERTDHHVELLWVLWLVIKADGLIHENERQLLRHVTRGVGSLETELSALTAFASTVELDQARVWSMLEDAVGDLTALYDAAVVAAAVDGKVNANELGVLRTLAEVCSTTFDEAAVRAAAAVHADGRLRT